MAMSRSAWLAFACAALAACSNPESRTTPIGANDSQATAAVRADTSDRTLPRLRLQGRTLTTVDGQPFVWRVATAFRLVDYVADGNEAAAVRFLDWLRGEGFNGARVLSSLCCWFDLSLSDGARALPRTLALAAERGIYLEVVALAGTREGQWTPEEIRQHVAAVGRSCAAASNCAAVEIANENAHPSQLDAISDPGRLRALRAEIPAAVAVSMGSNCCGQSDAGVTYEGGDYITIHPARGGTAWERTRDLRALAALSAETGLFVVDDEGIGAGPRDEEGRRSADAEEFFARGALSRVLGIGVTFHFSSGLQAAPPEGPEAAAAQAFIAGTRIVPDDVGLTVRDAGADGSPVAAFSGATAVFAGTGARNVVVAIGVEPQSPDQPTNQLTNFTLRLDPAWTVTRTIADRPGVRVVEVERKAR
jgi:hypothetical protein